MLATWHSKEDTEIKTEEDNQIDTLEQDKSSSGTDTEQQQPTVIEEAVSLFEIIDQALINVRAQGWV